ncbi:protein of unknown function [Candidatus Nitrospira inopinata]|jgi:hypothetical protein|uniref:Uncharacterized protein n=1 Tax=Candidatus Nitrospira inopinata TaxID=1715989 RepID=A0A0S4KRG7_9BACT|nr:protein of unknown function [Candidatus Nitrospira inopinata]
MEGLPEAGWLGLARCLQGVSLKDVIGFLQDFLMPPTIAAATHESFERPWPAGGPWRPNKKGRSA